MAPKKNLCVVRQGAYAGARTTSCKKIPPVVTVKAAKLTAYRIAHKLNLPIGSLVMITVGRRHEGLSYWFHVQSGRITCRKGAMFGPRCGKVK